MNWKDIFFLFNILFGGSNILSIFITDILIKVFIKYRWKNAKDHYKDLKVLERIKNNMFDKLNNSIVCVLDTNTDEYKYKNDIDSEMLENDTLFQRKTKELSIKYDFLNCKTVNNFYSYNFIPICQLYHILKFLFYNFNIYHDKYLFKTLTSSEYNQQNFKFFTKNLLNMIIYKKKIIKKEISIKNIKEFKFQDILSICYELEENMKNEYFQIKENMTTDFNLLINKVYNDILLREDVIRLLKKSSLATNEEEYDNDDQTKFQQKNTFFQTFLNSMKYYRLRFFQIESLLAIHKLRTTKVSNYIYFLYIINFFSCLIGFPKYYRNYKIKNL